jgi:4-amino-4-deoxy-L-arabinose transferase-like glycosyltransferase
MPETLSAAAPLPASSPPAAGFIRWIERQPRTAFGCFLAVHFVVWSVLPALVYANLPLDLIEALVYGREWQLGYDKLPPLPWWLIEAAHRIFGADIAYYATAQIAVLIAFGAVFALARQLIGATGALGAVLIIDGLHYFQYTAVKFNHDVIQLPFWGLAGFAFHAALKRGRLGSWVLLGFALGGALWAKYFVVVLAAPYALFMLLDRQARRAWATPGPYVGLAVALLVAAPHVAWLFQTDFLPFAYANQRATAVRGWFDHILHPTMFISSQIFFLLPLFAIAAGLFWPLDGKKSSSDPFDRRIVTLLAFGPALTTIALSAVSGRGVVAMWGYPLWLFLGLWLVMAARVNLDSERLTRIVVTWGAIFAVFAAAFVANYTVLPYIDHRYRAVLFPGDQLGQVLTARFHEATCRPPDCAPLRYVIGSIWDGGNLSHYSPDQPRVLIDGLPSRTPWIDLADLRDKGAILVWTQGDPKQIPAAFAAIAPGAELGTPFNLPMRRGGGTVHVGWAILRPQ